MKIYVKKKIPKSDKYRRVKVRAKFYDMGQEKSRTRAIRDPKSGRLQGRYSGVPAYAADNGKYLMLKKSFDLNGDDEPELFKGQIIARLKKGTKIKPRYVIIKVSADKFKKVKVTRRKKK